ncbi:MAG: RHS repeat-associated core domain-containing protein [Nocardioides sp.]|uniref:RHS repeat-associated core domain-containing protein n=1 Tax=Nocardioides sp. TaxID=35761 RepID=UPI0039E2B896
MVDDVEVRLSYGGFASLFGGAWADRLVVTAYPACYLRTPELSECSVGVPVPAVNTFDADTLEFSTVDAQAAIEAAAATDPLVAEGFGVTPDVPLGPTPSESPSPSGSSSDSSLDSLSSSESPAAWGLDAAARGLVSVAGLMAAAPSGTGGSVYVTSGGAGNYGATPLNPSAGWQVSAGSGEFTYSYDFALPPALGGEAPGLGLSYSSGSVDGMTLAENSQATPAGLGWDLSTSYITRDYGSCAKDGNPAKGDLCWITKQNKLVDRLRLVMGGKSSVLVFWKQMHDQQSDRDVDVYRMRQDPGWRIVRFSHLDGAAPMDYPFTNPDNNEEGFRVETPDGSTYWFGKRAGASNSVWTVPVFGNDADEPCHASSAAASWCQQAWRWNLDLVTDGFGNRVEYDYAKQTNYYSRWASYANKQVYDRGGYLSRISYGFTQSPDHEGDQIARQIVDISTRDRCVQKLENPEASCDGPRATPGKWPDVPSDLICDANDQCDNASPSFFSTKRYYQVKTKTVQGRSSPNTRLVDTYTLAHTMPDPDGSGGSNPDEPDLWLNQILHTGNAGGADTSVPAVNFNAVALRNRVALLGGSNRTMFKFRVDEVRNETGGKVQVVYGHGGTACDTGYVDGRDRWDSSRECFPQKYAPPSGSAHWEWFHKYVVTRVALSDVALGYQLGMGAGPLNSPARMRVYDYEYRGDPAWRYLRSPNTDDAEESWNDWRGYAETIIHTRKVNDSQQIVSGDLSQRRVLVFRGMAQSKKNNNNDYGDVKLDTVEYDSNANEPVDHGYFQGMVAEEGVRDQDGSWRTRTYHDYSPIKTVDSGDTVDARIVGETETRYHVRNGSDMLTRTVSTDYNDFDDVVRNVLIGTVAKVTDHSYGTTQTTGEETRCTTTSWEAGINDGWVQAAKETTSYDGGCSGALAARQQWFYGDEDPTDPLAPGTDLERPAPTAIRTQLIALNTVPGAPEWSTVKTKYDTYGRTTKTTDPLGHVVDTTYNNGSNSGSNTQHDLLTMVTTSEPLTHGQTAVNLTELGPYRGLPNQVTDANGQVAKVSYDGLGRLTEVRKPGNHTGDPSIAYAYQVSATAPSSVVTTARRTDSVNDTTRVFYDGWGRELETHTDSVNDPGERLVAATGYDAQGLVAYSYHSVRTTTPGVLLNRSVGDVADNARGLDITENTYDALGRTVTSKVYGLDSAGNMVTSYDYAGNQTTVIAPTTTTGATRTWSDGWGNTLRLELAKDHDGNGNAIGQRADYTYDAANRLTKITSDLTEATGDSPVSWTYGYDMAGRRTTSTDPDTGTTTYTYDPAGNTTSVETSEDPKVATSYDKLGRPTKRYLGDEGATTVADEDLLATWDYDAATGVTNPLGRQVASTSYTSAGQFTTKPTGYDNRGRATGSTTSFPASWVGGSSGTTSYTVDLDYNNLDQVTSTSYPAAFDLPAATVATSYTASGDAYNKSTYTTTANPGAVTTLGSAGYSDRNQPTSLTSNGVPNTVGSTTLKRTYAWETRTGRLAGLTAKNTTNPNNPVTIADYAYTYYRSGNPTTITNTVPAAGGGTASGQWCYTYDWAGRLATAATGVTGDPQTCVAPSGQGQADAVLAATGAQAYRLEYGYDVDKLTSVTAGQPNTPGTDTATYTYTTGGHQAEQITTPAGIAAAIGVPTDGNLAYDDQGRITTWTPDTGPELSYGYDDQGNLAQTSTVAGDWNSTAGDGDTRTTNAYDTDGIRVLRQHTVRSLDAEGDPVDQTISTVYLGDLEITHTPATDTDPESVTATRHYTTPGGTPLADQSVIKTGASAAVETWTWLFTDPQHSVRATMTNTAAAAVETFDYTPYGDPVGGNDQATLPAERGYLDHTHDPGGDIRLDHRTYDPTLNILTTPDPILIAGNPQSLNPYAYALNNPISFSDPTGLICTANPEIACPSTDLHNEPSHSDPPGDPDDPGTNTGDTPGIPPTPASPNPAVPDWLYRTPPAQSPSVTPGSEEDAEEAYEEILEFWRTALGSSGKGCPECADTFGERLAAASPFAPLAGVQHGISLQNMALTEYAGAAGHQVTKYLGPAGGVVYQLGADRNRDDLHPVQKYGTRPALQGLIASGSDTAGVMVAGATCFGAVTCAVAPATGAGVATSIDMGVNMGVDYATDYISPVRWLLGDWM